MGVLLDWQGINKLTVCINMIFMHTMKKRATITIDPQLHKRAKRLAKARHTTVSGLFEEYLRGETDPYGSVVDRLIGSAKLKSTDTGNDPRREALERKYLK